MTIKTFNELLESDPFRPFIILLANGRSLDVPGRNHVWASPSGRTFIVYQPDDRYHFLDLLLVAEIEVRNGSGAGGPDDRGLR